jgi:hypothetical protein
VREGNLSSIVISSAAVVGKSELGRVRSDPRIRAEWKRQDQREREARLLVLAKLENFYCEVAALHDARDAKISDGIGLMLCEIEIVRKALTNGGRPGFEMIRLRQIHEQVSTALGADTVRGLKVRKGAREGHRGRYGSAAEKREKYQPVVNKIASSNPHLSRREINRRAGQELGGVSYKAIERHTTDPRTKKK